MYCTAAGAIFLTALATTYSAKNPNCDGNNGQSISVSAPPRAPKCDGSTTYPATSSVDGSGIQLVTEIKVTTDTDNVLLIDVLGSPTNDPLCTNSAGSSQWCFDQNYKTAVPNSYTGKSGNIKWNYNIFCGAKLNPDIYGTVPQLITCQ